MSSYRLIHGNCLDVMPTIETASIDAVICDPPYPCIKRSYGYWTEEEWFALMKPLVGECRRVLKPKGSAVFVLQPNSERVGKMRTWLWEFMAWVGREWGIVQDAYWWNIAAAPTAHCHRDTGLMKPSLKSCVWAGSADCYRNQSEVLWAMKDEKASLARTDRALKYRPSGYSIRDGRMHATAIERGGSVPPNVFPAAGRKPRIDDANRHGAATPEVLCDWWTRYIVPPNGTVLDPFAGTATSGIAALKRGHDYIGIEAKEEYIEIAQRRLLEVEASTPLFTESSP